MKIHQNFVGGNIRLKERCGNVFYLENELRDTTQDWFYWAFCVEDAEAGEFVFRFQKDRIGYWGAAVSSDLVNWSWVNNREGESFRYVFSGGETLYFAHHMLYHPTRLFRFAREHGIPVSELCKSRRERSVPCLSIGQGSRSILLTARNHACESTGSYVLEGVLQELCEHPIDDTRIFCVPFVDYDGVIDGDQGKARAPHDHNRDYKGDTPHIYPEVIAILQYADTYGCHYGFDFHSPWHLYGENDTVFIVQNSIEKLDRQKRFAEIFESEITEGSMRYSKANDHPPFVGWNQPSSSFSVIMTSRAECYNAHTLETCYFGTEDNKVEIAKLLELGRCYGKAISRYIQEQKTL